MKTKTVKLIFGVAVLAVLSGTYVGVRSFVTSQEKKEAEKADTSISFVDADSDKIVSISFTTEEDKKEVFEKKEDSWEKKGEEAFPVSQDTIKGAVNTLASLNADQELNDPEDLREYDLDQPQKEISFIMDDGSETVLQIGMENESTNQYYVKKADDENVYLVSGTSLEPFMGTAYEFAKAEAFPSVNSATIKDVKVEKENGYELKQDADSLLWYVSDGKNSEQADTAKAGTVTTAIGSLTYEDFVDYNCTDETVYGFDDPYATITSTYMVEEEIETNTDATEASESEEKIENDETEEKEKIQVEKDLVIYIGNETEGSRYVKINDSNQVYTIAEVALADILDKGISDFYNLTVNYLTVNNLESLEIQSEEGIHTAAVIRTEKEKSSEEEESDDDTSEVTLSYTLDGQEIEESDFTTFYNKLINMTGQERLTEVYTPDQDAAYTFTFTDTDGKETVVSYYEYDSSFYAAVVEDRVYLVNKMNVRDLEEAYQNMI